METIEPEIQMDNTFSQRKVLIIDDELDFAESQQDILRAKGYQVEIATSLTSARTVLSSFDVDVALIDIRMGAKSGLELVPEIRRRYPKSLCVMSTAVASADTVIMALQKGAYDYLCKPYYPEDLFATMARCFERIRLEQEKCKAEENLVTRNQELEQINRRLKRMVESMQTITYCTTIPELCPLVLEQFAHNMVADGGSVYLFEDEQLVLKHALDPGHAPTTIPLPLVPSSVFDRVMHSKQPVLVISGDMDQQNFMPSGWTGYGSGSLLAFPLLGQAEEIIGVLSLHEKQGLHFTQQDKELGLILIAYISEAIRAVKALEDFKASEEQVRLLLNSTSEGIFGVDSIGNCIFVNSSCLTMLGYDQENDFLGINMHSRVHHTHHDDGSNLQYQCHIDKAFRENVEVHLSDELFFRANGSSFSTECWSRPIRKNNRVIGSVITFIDITERKRIENELNTYRLDLEEKVNQRTTELLTLNEELSDFAHSISHDLKAPLRAIEGFSEFLQDEYSEALEQTGRAYLKEINVGSIHMAHLIDDLLAHARLGDKFSMIGSLKVYELIDRVLTNLASDIESSRAKINVDVNFSIISGHMATLEILIQNLISNAIKFVAPSTTPEIFIGASESASEYHFTVRDNGIGIDKRHRDRIFKIFERLHTEDEYSGTGIGLAIARKAVILHKGTIWVNSDTGIGSDFHFTISKNLFQLGVKRC